MSIVHKFSDFNTLNESQSKKLKKYFTFSVVLGWYRQNKEKLANILGCNVSDMATEETLMEQSYELINNIINSQNTGNSGRENIEIAGFSEFKKLEKNLIHEILHNIYNVQSKEFNKSLSGIEYSESEIFEEIEILGIEESFMKYMNITYPKTDFVNQNINLLASYLMMSILKDDPTRIKNILNKEVEPYLEIYGKKYTIKGTPYENFFELFNVKTSDFENKWNRGFLEKGGDESDVFKEYMIWLINVDRGIENSGGDRANYPNGDFYGLIDFNDLKEDDLEKAYDNYVEYKNDGGSLVTFKINDDEPFNTANLKEKGIDFKLIEWENPKQLKLFKDFEPFEMNSRTDLALIPIKKEFVDEDGMIDTDAWFEWLGNKLDFEIPEFKGNKYLSIHKDEDTYSIANEDEFTENVENYYNEYNEDYYDEKHKFIDFEKYREMSFEEVVETFFYYDDDALPIMRRNFRTNDVFKNNTKLGNVSTFYRSWGQDDIVNTKKVPDQKNPGKYKQSVYKYTDFTKSDFLPTDSLSISKNILTENGQKLIKILNELRGYLIKNIHKIKKDQKDRNTKFTPRDIEIFKNIDLRTFEEMFNCISTFDYNKPPRFNFHLYYMYSTNKIRYLQNDEFSFFEFFFNRYEIFKSFIDKIENKEDMEYFLNFTNEASTAINIKDFEFLKNCIEKIEENRQKITNYKFITLYSEMLKIFNKKNNYEIPTNPKTGEALKNIFKSDKKDAFSDRRLKNCILNIFKIGAPNIKFGLQDILIEDFDSFSTNFIIDF